MKTGVRKDGTITAQRLRTALDGGAYGSYGVASTYYTGALQTVTYKLPAYEFQGIRAFTNKPPCGPKRGHGTPQPRFGFEVQLDKISVALGKNPADLRLNMLAEPNSVTANWLKIGSMGLRQCIEAVVAGSGFRERWGKLPEGRGLGLACGSYLCGAGLPIYWNHMPQSGVMLKLDRSGGIAAFCGEAEIGQGSDSVLAAVVAEGAGRRARRHPPLRGGHGPDARRSRQLLLARHADDGQRRAPGRRGARDLIAQAVAQQLEVPKGRLVFAERTGLRRRGPGEILELPGRRDRHRGPLRHARDDGELYSAALAGRYRGAGVGPSPAYSYSASVIEVEVDPETGLWNPLHVWIAHDIGKSLNPVMALGPGRRRGSTWVWAR